MEFNVSQINIRSFNKEQGTAIVRFSWNSCSTRKVRLVTVNLFGEYVFEPFNVWERDRQYRVHELKFNEWMPVITELKEEKEEA